MAGTLGDIVVESFIQENQIFVGIALVAGLGLVGAIFMLGGFEGGGSGDWGSDFDSDFGDFD